ncbi:hypothetical protein GCM10018966_026610 [Streptomyces yanii]
MFEIDHSVLSPESFEATTPSAVRIFSITAPSGLSACPIAAMDTTTSSAALAAPKRERQETR